MMEELINTICRGARIRRLILFTLIQIVVDLATCPWKKLKKYRKLLGRRSARKQWRRKSPRAPSEDSDSFNVNNIDIYERTGLFDDQFEQLHQQLAPLIIQPQRGQQQSKSHPALSSRKRLLITLHWLRDYHKLRTLRDYYGVSVSTISRTIHHIIPKLYSNLNEIQWPAEISPGSILGSVDCTSHFRFRVHPRQADYYRADKHGFFITAQVTISLSGQLYNVQLGLGHNNDRGMFRLTKLDQFLSQNNCYLLADKGYSHDYLITPDDDMPKVWNDQQKGLRSRVEAVIGLVKHYSCCSMTFRQGPELQQYAILICYQLQALMLKEYPIALI